MEIDVVASTKPTKKWSRSLSKEKALMHGAKSARICYTAKNWDKLSKEKKKTLEATKKLTLTNGHQSVYEHVHYNLYLDGIPKILAMFLNNENVYVTSEKSARYTKMKLSPEEKKLYGKWMENFKAKIEKSYPFIDKKTRGKLAQENARYLTSVFTPTKMEHTLSFRQLNYVMHWFDSFIAEAPMDEFNNRLKPHMQEFNDRLSSLYVDDLRPGMKFRNLSMLAERSNFKEFFDECYSTNYKISFAGLAQAHRHRTIKYRMQPPESSTSYFVPPIISNDIAMSTEWLEDMKRVRKNFPQAMLLDVNERGLYEDFISKAGERLCGRAQLEIMKQTKATLDKYLEATKESNPAVYQELLPYSKGPKCSFPDYKCKEPCNFKRKSLERLI